MKLLTLHDEHHYVLDQIARQEGITFLTGKAGTGKSTLLNLFKRITDKNVIILAPTGVAAINVRGQTIHSFFKFPPGWINTKDLKVIPKKFVDKIDLIIIDEISMVRADIIDHIHFVLSISKKSNAPFGGIPMVWIGDPFQLPPVVSSTEEKEIFSTYYQSPYFFSAKIFSQIQQFEMIELHTIFRQKEMHFIKLLNKIRMGECEEEDLELLNTKVSTPRPDEDFRIWLCTTNQRAYSINQKKLADLKTNQKSYKAQIHGTVHPSQFPNEELLLLKEGSQIMMLRNDTQKNFVNGSIGTIIKLNEDSVQILLENAEKPIEVERITWEIIRYTLDRSSSDAMRSIQSEVVGTFSQFPLKPAWAITIHKSQGKTFEKMHIDLGTGAFENGQLYVALSRSRSLDGISLQQKIKMRDIMCDERLVDFMRKYS